ncbi:MAG: imidazolonepropionase [Candidatus Thermoplasmatota archaeon]|nr:imidazolonepropionase [Candidatus Thermoplasmatota archaeon]
MKTADLLIENANEIVTLKGKNHPRIQSEMNELGVIKKGSIAIKDDKILDVGSNLQYKAKNKIDAKGKIVLPGFVDSHTHVIFSGSREFELDMKLKGFSYMDILNKGGGIFYTVDKTRKSNINDLIEQSKIRLNNMLKYGTTTCEGKSGYGLNIETELKILKTQKILNDSHPIDIISTFLGAHAVPKECNIDEYVDLIINDMIPKLSNYAKFCDVFCEKGVFTVSQARSILNAGKKKGLIPKIHADEIIDTGGAALAADINAISADHLLRSSKDGLELMAKKGIIGVLLPATPFSLMMNEYANARNMIDTGIPVAIATDLNPNCWTESMQFIIQLACLNMKMTPAEAITAATYNAACAIDLNNHIGSLEIGKQADLVILDCPNYMFIPYHYGINLVDRVIKNGKIINF